MNAKMIALIVSSVTLSAGAQILLKFGMSRPSVQDALGRKSFIEVLFQIGTSAGVIVGLLSFGLSVVLWLFVLSRVDVSYAYPFVALGMVLTVLSGWLVLGEALSLLRVVGLVMVVVGVCVIALSGTTAD